MRLFPLTQKRERTVLTWQGWLLALALLVTAAMGLMRGIYPFLAVNDPLYGGPLVVEGWMPDSALRAAIAEFRQHSYTMLLVTGSKIEHGAAWQRFDNYAEYGAATIARFGFPPDSVHPIKSMSTQRDRTYTTAKALVAWLNAEQLPARFAVMSLGPHARRTRLLYQKACGAACEVGIISIENPAYDKRQWWQSSAGFRDVVGEAIAYGYARLLFWPSRQEFERA